MDEDATVEALASIARGGPIAVRNSEAAVGAKKMVLTRKRAVTLQRCPARGHKSTRQRAFPSHVPAPMDDKIAQFCQVTGCVDPAKAKFFLESSNGEIDAAISAFFGAPRPSVSPEISHP